MFVIPRSRSEQLLSMPRRARRTAVSRANRPNGVLSCHAPPPIAALPSQRRSPTRPWYVPVLNMCDLRDAWQSMARQAVVICSSSIRHPNMLCKKEHYEDEIVNCKSRPGTEQSDPLAFQGNNDNCPRQTFRSTTNRNPF